jgi:hypothetical protein
VKIILPAIVDESFVSGNANTAPISFCGYYTNTTAYSPGDVVYDDRRSNFVLNYDYVCITAVPAAGSRETYRPEQPGGAVHPSWARFRTSNAWAAYDPSPNSRTYATNAAYDPTLVVPPASRTLTFTRPTTNKFTGTTNDYPALPEHLLGFGSTVLVNAVALINALGATVVVKNSSGTTINTTSMGAQGQSGKSVVIDGLSVGSAGASFTVDITGSSCVPAVGTFISGWSTTIGDSLPGVEVGILDYSSVVTDTYGNTSITKRGYAKTVRMKVRIASSNVDSVHRKLAALRATPVVWVGEDAFDSTIVYGIFKSFSVDIAYPTVSYCTIEVNGIA